MKRLARILLMAAVMAVAVPQPALRGASLWELTAPLSAREAEALDESGMEIGVRDGVVTLVLARPTQVRVLTILGQPLSQETLPAGVHRLKLTTRGIYIVKVGQLTRRVTV